MNIGLVLPNWIGDVVMATPAIRGLREFYGPDAQLIGVMKPYVADVLAGTGWLSESLFYEPRSADRERRNWRLVRRLRELHLDTMFVLTNSLRGGLLAWFSGARLRVGYGGQGREWLLNRTIPRPQRHAAPIPSIDQYLAVAYAAGCPPQPRRLELATQANDERGADLVWSNLGLDRLDEVICLNAGGAHGSSKHWPHEHCVRLCRQLVSERPGAGVLVLCGPGEATAAARIAAEAAHPRVCSMAEQDLALGVAKACLRRSAVLVSTDSGPRHIAAALGVPVIGLLGPFHPLANHSYSPSSRDLWLNLPCAPCGQRACPLGHHRCLRDLTPEFVSAQVHELLAGGRNQGAVAPPSPGWVQPLRTDAA